MRSQIIHLTLRQEGSTERRRAKLKERGGKNTEPKGRKANSRMNCKREQEEADWTEERNGDEESVCVCVCLRERTGEMERKRK